MCKTLEKARTFVRETEHRSLYPADMAMCPIFRSNDAIVWAVKNPVTEGFGLDAEDVDNDEFVVADWPRRDGGMTSSLYSTAPLFVAREGKRWTAFVKNPAENADADTAESVFVGWLSTDKLMPEEKRSGLVAMFRDWFAECCGAMAAEKLAMSTYAATTHHAWRERLLRN